MRNVTHFGVLKYLSLSLHYPSNTNTTCPEIVFSDLTYLLINIGHIGWGEVFYSSPFLIAVVFKVNVNIELEEDFM